MIVENNSALHIAVENKDVCNLAHALQTTGDINISGKYGRTALHLAAKSELSPEMEIMSFLLNHGADVTIKNAHGFTPLYVAVIANNINGLRVLLTHPRAMEKIDVDAVDLGGMSPLISACCNGCSVDIVDCLLEHHASMSLKDSIGRTALDWAKAKQFDSLAALLLARVSSAK